MTFAVKGCKVTVSFLFLAAVAFFLFEDRSGSVIPNFAAALLHECGHFAALYAFHTGLSTVRLTPFGVDMVKSGGTERSYGKDILISLAGPAVNLFAVLLCLLFRVEPSHPFFLANAALAGFNLLPIESLDGGQVLYSVLCRIMPESAAGKAVSAVSFLVLTPLAAAAFLALFRSPWNFPFFLICVYLMALLVLKRGRYY